MDAAEWAGALKEAIETNNWRPFFVKTEAIAAGMAASAVTGFAFSIILGGPVGLLGYSLIMAGVGTLRTANATPTANYVGFQSSPVPAINSISLVLSSFIFSPLRFYIP
ncbi:colicin [Serratia nevei]|nr:colicin [Serratia nevei]